MLRRVISSGRMLSTAGNNGPKSTNKRVIDKVASDASEMEAIDRAAHHIQEEDLEHDALGMRDPHHQHHHEPKLTWKDAERELNHKSEDSNRPQLSGGSKKQ